MSLRKVLVRAAGMPRIPWLMVGMAVEGELAWIDWARGLATVAWGDLPPERKRRVSVPRRLRPALGRYVWEAR